MTGFIIYLPIIIALALYFTGIPIAYALMTATLTFFTFIDTTSHPYLLMQKFITSTQSFPFLAIPFFVMAGSLMNYSGMSEKLMAFADALTGHMKGGLAQINVLLSMLMGGCSGSANADAAMECKMLVPEMEKRGYGKGFSAAITAAHPARHQPDRLRSDRGRFRRQAVRSRLSARPADGHRAHDHRQHHRRQARLQAQPRKARSGQGRPQAGA